MHRQGSNAIIRGHRDKMKLSTSCRDLDSLLTFSLKVNHSSLAKALKAHRRVWATNSPYIADKGYSHLNKARVVGEERVLENGRLHEDDHVLGGDEPFHLKNKRCSRTSTTARAYLEFIQGSKTRPRTPIEKDDNPKLSWP